jgi:hypothetical protein
MSKSAVCSIRDISGQSQNSILYSKAYLHCGKNSSKQWVLKNKEIINAFLTPHGLAQVFPLCKHCCKDSWQERENLSKLAGFKEHGKYFAFLKTASLLLFLS